MRNRGQSPPLLPILFAVLLAGGGAAAGAENIDPAGDGHQYAWGENVGWVNVEPSDDGGNGVEVADFKLTGWMWGENIGWINVSCENTSVCGDTDFGVLNDGSGHLSGFAWSENAGWINFAPTTCLPDPTCGVRIDPATGYFTGRAWGENIGWISFSAGSPEGWTARTSWCQGSSAPPGPVAGLTVGSSGPGQVLSWTPLSGASWYDVVGGTLSALRASHGDFFSATDRCLAGRLAASSSPLPPSPPIAGDGLWFVVRGSNCRGRGTYDSGASSQSGSRDAGIAASRRDCP